MVVNKKGSILQNERTRFNLNTDTYIDKAIQSIFDAEKFGFEQGHSYKDGLTMKCLAVDQLENVALGLEIIKLGSIDEENNQPYQAAIDKYKESNPAPKSTDKDELLYYNVKRSNFRFRMILNALKKNNPSNIDFTL